MEQLLWNAAAHALIVAAGVAVYTALSWLKTYLLHALTVQLTIHSDDHYRRWECLMHYLSLQLDTSVHFWKPGYKSTETGLLAPSTVPVPISFTFEGVRVRLRIDERQVADNQSRRRSYTATLWARKVNPAFFVRLLREMERVARMAPVRPSLLEFNAQGACWYEDEDVPFPVRSVDSVTLDPAVKAAVLRDLDAFVTDERRAFHARHGLHYRRGYLLTGPPGNGKSSFIAMVAHRLRANVARIALRQATCDDTTLATMMRGADVGRPPRILLLEDIDCLFATREDQPKRGVTFSGLLNALDGLGAAENAIVFMTTNHPERLDPALVRPGRIDMKVEFVAPTPPRIVEFYQRFFPEEREDSLAVRAFVAKAERQSPLSYAVLQSLVLAELAQE